MNGDIEQRLSAIEQRNVRVATDKAWEVSGTRRAAISVLTYFVVVATLMLIHADRPWLGAVVPVCGYLLSTLSLPPLKVMWARNTKNRGISS